MNGAEIRAATSENGNPHVARVFEDLGSGVAVRARGATVTLDDGRELVDLCSGGFGYAHPRVVEAVRAQVQAMPLSFRLFFSRPLARLLERLAALTPGELAVSFFGAAGAEGVEGALKLAKGYHRGRRRRFVAALRGYHGGTTGALSVCGIERLRAPLRTHPIEATFVPYGDLAALEQAVDQETAGVILEPVQAGLGVEVPPRGYLAGARARCDATGALFICDEVTTGLGRTGERFGIENDAVAPDIMVLAGALGGGVLPIGAYVTTRAINDAVYDKRDPLLHANTTGGNPAACAAALAALEVMDEEDLPGRARRYGAEIQMRANAWRDRFPHAIAAVGGRGLLFGVRLSDPALGREVQREALARGALVRLDGAAAGEAWIGIRPPLLIDSGELERGLGALEGALEAAFTAAPQATA